MKSRGTQILTSVQADLTRALVGGSPFVGDMSSTGIQIPATPTSDQQRRYLFQLFSVDVPAGSEAIIHSLHQLLYIGTDLEEENNQPDAQWLIEVPVTDPLWSFPDGNVSWHLRSCDLTKPDTTIFDDQPWTTPYSNRRDSIDSCLLARDAAPNYLPLNGGQPYGQPVEGLGTFRDMRFPWKDGTEQSLGIVVSGGTHIVLYASVYQTNPERRPNKPVGIETAGLRSEDVFVLNYPQARYTRVGGRIKFEIQPLTNAQMKGAI